MGVLTFFKLYKWYQIAQRTTYNWERNSNYHRIRFNGYFPRLHGLSGFLRMTSKHLSVFRGATLCWFSFFFQINYDHLILYFRGMTSGETTTNFEGSTFAKLNTSMLSGWQNHSQPALTCSKLTIETVEQSVKYVQTKGTPMASFWYLYC